MYPGQLVAKPAWRFFFGVWVNVRPAVRGYDEKDIEKTTRNEISKIDSFFGTGRPIAPLNPQT